MRGRRRQARQSAVQAIYQWQMTGQDLREIEEHILSLTEQDLAELDIEYYRELLHAVPTHLRELDRHLSPTLDRAIERVDPVERAILRLGAYELLYHSEIPFRVIINEAVELAKLFGAAEGHKYVNGVLDRMAQQVRRAEAQGPR